MRETAGPVIQTRRVRRAILTSTKGLTDSTKGLTDSTKGLTDSTVYWLYPRNLSVSLCVCVFFSPSDPRSASSLSRISETLVVLERLAERKAVRARRTQLVEMFI